MLKIKDNVDLKELEKYGFKYLEVFGCWQRVIEFGRVITATSIYDDKEIDTNLNENDTEKFLIQDLIKADLVEKVEDK